MKEKNIREQIHFFSDDREEASLSRRIRCRFWSAMARSVVRGITAMAGSESGVAGHAMATLRGAAPAMTHQALAASTPRARREAKLGTHT